MTTKDTESKTITWNSKVYTEGEIDKAYEWMLGSSKYWFSCKNKPKNPLTFLGFRIKHRSGNPYYLCYFKEVDSDNYYKAEFPYSDSGWNEELDGEWAWVSNTDPYPNTPINVKWELTRNVDAAYLVTNDPYEHVYYYECEKPEGDIKQIGQWKLSYGDLKGEPFSWSGTTVRFYDDGNNIYRSIKESSGSEEQWYTTTGREWPGVTTRCYPECRTVVEGLIETGNVTLVTGVKYSGKSHLIAQLCTCVTNGIPFLGMNTRTCEAVHLNYDMSEDGLGIVYEHVNNFYGKKKVASTYVATGKPPISGEVTASDILTGIESCCIENKMIRLIAIDSVDLFGLDTYYKTGSFISDLKRLASKYKVAIVYSCSAEDYREGAVNLAETCDDNGLHAELPRLLMGIIPDSGDDDMFEVHLINDFDVNMRIRCKKNAETHYCFDVEAIKD